MARSPAGVRGGGAVLRGTALSVQWWGAPGSRRGPCSGAVLRGRGGVRVVMRSPGHGAVRVVVRCRGSALEPVSWRGATASRRRAGWVRHGRVPLPSVRSAVAGPHRGPHGQVARRREVAARSAWQGGAVLRGPAPVRLVTPHRANPSRDPRTACPAWPVNPPPPGRAPPARAPAPPGFPPPPVSLPLGCPPPEAPSPRSLALAPPAPSMRLPGPSGQVLPPLPRHLPHLPHLAPRPGHLPYLAPRPGPPRPGPSSRGPPPPPPRRASLPAFSRPRLRALKTPSPGASSRPRTARRAPRHPPRPRSASRRARAGGVNGDPAPPWRKIVRSMIGGL